jgi:SAM-dependent methyltransferase
MAQHYPASTFVGIDFHEDSITAARKRAADAGVADRVTFEVAGAGDYPGNDYDLVCIFDALHDMGDPVGAAQHIRESLRPDGTWLLVEPMAGATLLDNLHPVGRIFYSASVLICTPSAQAQEGGYALGNQVPDGVWQDLLIEAGFTRFRRAAETPFNRVFEVRP